MNKIILSQAPSKFFMFGDNPTITVDVEFGVPNKNGECVLSGICRISEVLPMANINLQNRCRVARALLRLGITDRLYLFFPKDIMRPCVCADFFSEKTFPVPLSVTLPMFITQALKIPEHAYIKKGSYLIEDQGERYILPLLIDTNRGNALLL